MMRARLSPQFLALACGVLACAQPAACADAGPDRIETAERPVAITPIQHASLLLEAAGKRIYIDPAPADLFANRPKADLILITDIHGDHMDKDAVRALSSGSTKVIAPSAVAKTITQAQVLDNGAKTTWGDWTIEAVPMYNQKRGPGPGRLFHTRGRGNGYVLSYGGKRFYIAGDTEGIPEMRALKNIDVAFIPMNLPYTMPVTEAADAVKAFHPAIAYPYHYRNGDASKADVAQFKSALDGTGIDVRLRNWYPE